MAAFHCGSRRHAIALKMAKLLSFASLNVWCCQSYKKTALLVEAKPLAKCEIPLSVAQKYPEFPMDTGLGHGYCGADKIAKSEPQG